MKTNVKLEQCGAGWKVFAEIEDAAEGEAFEAAKRLIEKAAEFTMGLPGWNLGKEDSHEDPEQNKWRKAYFARKNWARGLGK